MMNNDEDEWPTNAFAKDDVLVYKHLWVDPDKIRPVIMKLKNALYDVANGITGEVGFDGTFYTEDVSGRNQRTRCTGPRGGIFYTEGSDPVYCDACYAGEQIDDDTDIYKVNVYKAADEVDFNRNLCPDCAEGFADELEDYINDNMGDLLGDAL